MVEKFKMKGAIVDKNLIEIKNYWNEQAKNNVNKSLATSPDTIAYDMEIEQMKKMLPEHSKVMDIGCGNGIKGIELTKALDIDYVGIDYSEEMVNQAQNMMKNPDINFKGKIRFKLGNILDLKTINIDKFDVVMTDRCVINLSTIENQISAIKNIHSILKKDGIYLMFENSIQALENLNKVRRSFELPDINVRWHNIYIDEEKIFSSISDYFKIEESISFASSYYLISRTLNALLNNKDGQVDYMSDLNKLSAKLPPIGDYSPLKLFVLRKK